MNSRIIAIPVLAAIWLGSPVPSLAQHRQPRHAQSRPQNVYRPRPAPAPVYRPAYGPRYYPPSYYNRWAYNTYRVAPFRYVPWSLIYGSVGFANSYYSFGLNYGYPTYPAAYPAAYPTAYPAYSGPAWYGGGSYASPSVQLQAPTGYDTGSVRLDIRPRDAQVFVDGYYAGRVDDFDGSLPPLRLEPGGHKIEVRMPGFQTFEIDVHVQPGRTLTIREDLHP